MAIEHKPPEDLILTDTDRLYFLAGPIQGAPDWQHDAVQYLDKQAPRQAVHIANPRREHVGSGFDKSAQIRWEKRNLWRASLFGGIIFWLAAQDFSLPYESGRLYAQTTRQEFGRAMGWLDYNPSVRVSLGMEPGYNGNEDYYRDSANEFSIPVFDNLEDTIDYALRR